MTPSREIKIGLIQRGFRGAREDALSLAVQGIQAAAGQGAQVVCLQELFNSPYFCQNEDPDRFALAESIPGPTTEELSALAKRLRIVVIAPVFEKRAEGLYYNSAAVIDADGSVKGIYRKMHIPDDPLYYEKFYFGPGDLGFKTFETRYARIGVLICWDQWFPEGARLTAMGGAQILFYPTAIGWIDADRNAALRKKQLEAWMTIQRAHAIANGVFVAAVNRVGREGKILFWGSSFVCDPFGEIVSKAGEGKDETLVVSCNLGRIEQVRHDWPFLRDRRVDAYHGLTKRYLD